LYTELFYAINDPFLLFLLFTILQVSLHQEEEEEEEEEDDI